MNIELPNKLYYSIGEVAEAFGVNASLIRFWTKNLTFSNLKRTQKETGCLLPRTLKT